VIVGLLFAVCAAASNALGTVFQRKAARLAPPEETMRLALLADLLRRPVWLLGIAGLIGGFIFQAAALHFAALALVQPVVVAELPLTLAVAALVFQTRLDRDAVWGTVAVSAGVAVVLVATAPQHGHPVRGELPWLAAGVVSVVVCALLVVAGLNVTGPRRAALFGVAAGIGFGFTAALINGAVHRLDHGLGELFSSWQLYAMIVAGIGSVFLAQNALQAGPIVAAQPPITTCDPLASVGYGVLLFGEQLRGGYWVLAALVGTGIVLGGTVLLSRSPLIALDTPGQLNPGSAGPTGPRPSGPVQRAQIFLSWSSRRR
jgi:drug/metabolite transporter (DMT)-like permease